MQNTQGRRRTVGRPRWLYGVLHGKISPKIMNLWSVAGEEF